MRIYHFNDWQLDTGRKLLSKHGVIAHLEPQQLAVLTFLLANDNRTVQTSELIAQVWSGATVEPNAVHYAISCIRRAMGESSRSSMIEARKGHGYRMIAHVTWTDDATGPRDPGRWPMYVASFATHMTADEAMAEADKVLRGEAARGFGG